MLKQAPCEEIDALHRNGTSEVVLIQDVPLALEFTTQFGASKGNWMVVTKHECVLMVFNAFLHAEVDVPGFPV